jgi:hypothetical protein
MSDKKPTSEEIAQKIGPAAVAHLIDELRFVLAILREDDHPIIADGVERRSRMDGVEL